MFNLVLLCSHEICLPEKHMVTVVTLIKDNDQDNQSPMLPTPQKKIILGRSYLVISPRSSQKSDEQISKLAQNSPTLCLLS